MALGTPTGGGSGGFWGNISNQAKQRQSLGGAVSGGATMGTGNAPQSQMSSWLQSQIGAQNGLYNSQLSALTGMGNAARASTGSQVGYNNQQSALNSQLLNQQRFRDVDLGQQTNDLNWQRAQSQFGNNSAGLANQLNIANRTFDQQRNNLINQQTGQKRSWAEEQRYINELQGFGIQNYNAQNDALNYGEQTAARDLGEVNKQAGIALSNASTQLGLSTRELDQLRKMSATERDHALADVAAGRGFNDRQLAELNRALDAARGFNDADWAETQRSIDAGRDLSGRSFAELQRDLGERRGTTDESIAIQRWLNEQNTGTNDANLGLNLRQSAFQEQAQRRDVKSAAITGGALSSRGLGLDYDELAASRGFADEGSRLTHKSTGDALSAALRGDENQYNAALDQLTNQLNTGQIAYDSDLEAYLGQFNRGQQQYARGNEDILGSRNRGQLAFDQQGRALTEQSRNASTNYNNTMQQAAIQGDRNRADYSAQQAAIQAQQRQGNYNYKDALQQIEQGRGQNLLGYQQDAAGLQNRYNTGQIGNFNNVNSLNNQALMNSIGIDGTRSGIQNQQNALRNQLGYDRGMYGINNQSLNSLGQTYGTRSQLNQVGNSAQNAALQNQLAQQLYGYGQQGMGLLQQQQQGNANLYGQALAGAWGTY